MDENKLKQLAIILSQPLHVLFISYDGMTDPLGQSQVIPYMQGLRKVGYQITILSCEKKAIFEERCRVVQDILDGVGIEWVPLKYTRTPPVISAVYDLYKLKLAAKKIHSRKKIHLVHTRAGTPAMVGSWLKKKYGIKFLNDLRDFFADSRVDAGAWNQQSFLYRRIYKYFKKAELDQLRHSDGIVCLTHAAEKVIRAWPAYKADIPLAVIPCSVDLSLFDPKNISQHEIAALREKLTIAENDIIISYLGSLGGWYLTAEMMQFFKRLLVELPQARFLFISPHSAEYILETAGKYGVPAGKIISLKGYRPEIPLLLSLSTYSIFFIMPCYSKQASSPTKHGELMAMGIPVITNSGVGDVATIVEDYNSGIVVNDFTDESFDKAIHTLTSSDFDKAEIRKGAFKVYALENAISLYATMYQSILEDKV